MQRFGFPFTIILLRNACVLSCYFADLWFCKYMKVKELLIASAHDASFAKTISISYMCCGRLLGKSEEKNIATGLTRTSFSHNIDSGWNMLVTYLAG